MRKRRKENRAFDIGERVILNEDIIANTELEKYFGQELFVLDYIGVDEDMNKTDMFKVRTKRGEELPMYVYEFEIMLY